MKILKSIGIALVVSISCLVATTSQASSFFSTQNPALTDYVVLYGPTFSLCLEGSSCDGSWTQSSLPSLGVGDQISFSATSSNFDFYLGNHLSGDISITLTPSFNGDATPTGGELLVNILNRTVLITQGSFGVTTFNAIDGTDYYLLLSGLVRGGGQTYEMQVSAVPLPASWFLLTTALMFFGIFPKKRKN